MNIENFSVEKMEYPSKLELIASEMPDKCMAVEKLDQPIFVLTQETRSELPSMTSETRERLEISGFPDTILDAIGSEAESHIYESANIEPEKINSKDALIRTDIDYVQKDLFGDTNLERMDKGKAPLDINGKPIELHHIGQKQDSPLAELTSSEHRGNGNDNILHNKIEESAIDREDFNKERQEHWKIRAENVKAQQ